MGVNFLRSIESFLQNSGKEGVNNNLGLPSISILFFF